MQDILLTEDYDIELKAGDFAVGNSSDQHIALMLSTRKGEWKQHPTTGIGLEDIVNDNEFATWRSNIVAQLEGDGATVEKLVIDSSGIDLEAFYK